MGAKGNVPLLPNYLGTAWYSNSEHIFKTLRDSDLIIAIGEDFTHFSTRKLGNYLQNTNIVQITEHEEEIGRSFSLSLGINSNSNAFLDALELSKKNWTAKFNKTNKESKTLKIIQSLAQKLPNNSTFFSDVGNAGYAAITDLELKDSQNFYTTGKFGSCGWSIPTAMGYSFGNQSRYAFVILGDLSFNMNIQDLINTNKLSSKITIFVFNNKTPQNISEDQLEILGKEIQTDVGEINIEMLAKGYSINFYQAKDNTDLTNILASISFESANIVEILLDKDDYPLSE